MSFPGEDLAREVILPEQHCTDGQGVDAKHARHARREWEAGQAAAGGLIEAAALMEGRLVPAPVRRLSHRTSEPPVGSGHPPAAQPSRAARACR